MANDFYSDAARRRLDQLNAEAQRCLADLSDAKSNDDGDTAAVLVERLADIQSAQNRVHEIHRAYQASLNPPAPPPVSREQRAARRIEEMDAQDMLDMTRGSKYAKGITWDDPNMRAGWAEAQRRRARGE
jgi:hypothetical protein